MGTESYVIICTATLSIAAAAALARAALRGALNATVTAQAVATLSAAQDAAKRMRRSVNAACIAVSNPANTSYSLNIV